MDKITLALGFILLWTSCSKDKTLIFQEKLLTKDAVEVCVNNNCPNFNIQYLEAISNGDNAMLFNTLVTNEVTKLLLSFQDTPSDKNINVQDALLFFIDDFRNYENDIGNNFVPYEADTYMEVIYQSPELISIDLNFYFFTGGAHGYGGTRFLNFDAKTGAILTLDQVFTDIQKIEEITEKMIREQYNIPVSHNINSTGFWFENDTFHLPENIGFTATEVLLIYNQYEIASYAEGAISLSIPKTEITQYLRFQ